MNMRYSMADLFKPEGAWLVELGAELLGAKDLIVFHICQHPTNKYSVSTQ